MIKQIIFQIQRSFQLKTNNIIITTIATDHYCKNCGRLFKLTSKYFTYCEEEYCSDDLCCECNIKQNLIKDTDSYVLFVYNNMLIKHVEVTAYFQPFTPDSISTKMVQHKHYIPFFIGV